MPAGRRSRERPPRHDSSPSERDSKNRLRDLDPTLAEGIDGRQEQPDGAQQHREGIECQDEERRDHGENKRDEQRLSWHKATGGQRPAAGSRDMFIKIAIGQVVEDDAQTPHDECPENKYDHQRSRRTTVIGQHHGPEAREHQQPGAGLVAQANEVGDGSPGPGRR